MVDIRSFISNDNDGVIFTCGLLLSPEQQSAAIALSHEVAASNPHSLKYKLDIEKHPPYVRLYETVIPEKNIEKAVLNLKQITRESEDLPIAWGQLESTKHFVAIWGENNVLLKDFQTKVLTDLNPLREGYYKEKYIEDLQEHVLTAEEEESFKKWGSPWADPYVPHVIVAKATPEFDHLTPQLEWKYGLGRLKGLIWGIRHTGGDFSKVNRIYFSASE